MVSKRNDKKADKRAGVDSSKIKLDSAGRFELLHEELNLVSGGMRGEVCRIQTDPRGCSMNI